MYKISHNQLMEMADALASTPPKMTRDPYVNYLVDMSSLHRKFIYNEELYTDEIKAFFDR